MTLTNAFTSSNFFQTQQPVVFTNNGAGATLFGNSYAPFIDTPQPFLTHLPSVAYCIF